MESESSDDMDEYGEWGEEPGHVELGPDEITDTHVRILQDAKTWSKEDVEKHFRGETRYALADRTGDRGKTLLHLMADSWTDSLIPCFGFLMEQFPELYQVQDELGRTVLSEREPGFLNHFLSAFQSQSLELIKHQPELLFSLLTVALRTGTLEKVIHQVPPELLLRQDPSGMTLLHTIIMTVYGRSRPSQLTQVPAQRLSLVAGLQPATLTMEDRQGLTPYSYHISRLKTWKKTQAVTEETKGVVSDNTKVPQPRIDKKDSGDSILQLKKIEVKSKPTPNVAEPSANAEKREVSDDKRRPILAPRLGARKLARPPRLPAAMSVKYRPTADTLEKITDILIRLMYRHLATADIMAELGGEGREFDLNFTDFERGNDYQTSASLSHVVEHLNLHQSLRYVLIPRRDSRTDDIPKLFDCLKRRGVRRIIRLEVDEDILFPHSDEVIAEAIAGLEIVEFNWRKTDMSLALLREHSRTRKVHLHSSGNHAVLLDWLSERCRGVLEKLERIDITFLPLVESPDTAYAHLKEFESSLRRIPISCPLDTHHLSPSAKREYTTWSAALSTPRESVAKFRPSIRRSTTELIPAILDLIGDQYLVHRPSVPVGVAVVDDGVDLYRLSEQASTRTRAGISFLADNHDGPGPSDPWYLSGTGRGTAIANLVFSFFPGVDFHFARVPIDPETSRAAPSILAKAVEWAVRMEIRIILLTAPPGPEDSESPHLHRALDDAEKRGILVLSPASDLNSLNPTTGRSNTTVHSQRLATVGSAQWALSGSRSNPSADLKSLADLTLSTKGIKDVDAIPENVVATACAGGIAALLYAALSSPATTGGHRTPFRFQASELVGYFRELSKHDKDFFSGTRPLEMLLKVLEDVEELREGNSQMPEEGDYNADLLRRVAEAFHHSVRE